MNSIAYHLGLQGRVGRQAGWPAVRARCAAAASILVLVALVLLMSARAAGGAEEVPPPESRGDAASADVVNMEFRDTDLTTVLRALCKGAGLDFILEPGVKGKVTAKLRNASWQSALECILRSHGLVAKREGTTLLVSPMSPDEAASPASPVTVSARPGGRLDLEANGAEVRLAIRELASAAKMNIVASKDISGTVTASLRDLSAEEILLALAGSVGASVANKGNLITVEAGSAGAPSRPAAAASEGRTPRTQAVVEVKSLDGGRLSVHAREAGLREVFAQLTARAGLNIVASAKLNGDTVTLDLEGVSPQSALAAIAAQANLEIRPLGDILFAAPAPVALNTETFRLRYAKAEEVAKVITSSCPEAKVAFEPANNLLIVTGAPELVAIARSIVEKVETPPIQVTIEARILETNLTGDKQLGIEWSDRFGINATTPTIPHSWPLSNSSESSYMPGYDPSDVLSRGDKAVPFAAADTFKFGFLTSTGLSMVLHMLQEEATTRMIANPTVTTVENQEAKINSSVKYPVATYQVSQETGVLTVSGFEYKEFGTILSVTPRVSDGHIILNVHPEVSRQAGVTQFQGADLPIIHSQETDTQVRIKDGDTLVIAGLIREDTENRRRDLPWLSKVPLLGYFFRSKHDIVDQRRNLLIFITPHIVGDADFARAAELKKKRTEPLPGAAGGPEREE